MQNLQTLLLLTASLSVAASQPAGQGRRVDPAEAKLAAQAEAILKRGERFADDLPSAPHPSAPQGVEAFQRMISYLADGGGRWRAPNPNHDPTRKTSPDAIGLWFQTSARGNLLQLTVVGHVGSRSSKWSESYWLWHPGRKEILYHEVGPDGAVRMGTTHFTDEHTFVTLTEAVSPTGSITSNRGENVIVDENTHRTTAYALDAEGKWIEQNALTWTRTPPGGAAPEGAGVDEPR